VRFAYFAADQLRECVGRFSGCIAETLEDGCTRLEARIAPGWKGPARTLDCLADRAIVGDRKTSDLVIGVRR
jgi:hypothetical protein